MVNIFSSPFLRQLNDSFLPSTKAQIHKVISASNANHGSGKHVLGFGPQIKLSQTSLRSQMISLLQERPCISWLSASLQLQHHHSCEGNTQWPAVLAGLGFPRSHPCEHFLESSRTNELNIPGSHSQPGPLAIASLRKLKNVVVFFFISAWWRWSDSKTCYEIPFLLPLGELFCWQEIAALKHDKAQKHSENQTQSKEGQSMRGASQGMQLERMNPFKSWVRNVL